MNSVQEKFPTIRIRSEDKKRLAKIKKSHRLTLVETIALLLDGFEKLTEEQRSGLTRTAETTS